MSTLIHITALLILIGRAGAYEIGNISGTEFIMSAIACFVIMAAGILIDRTREVRNQEDSGKTGRTKYKKSATSAETYRKRGDTYDHARVEG